MSDSKRSVRRPGGVRLPYRVHGTGAPPRLVFAHALTGTGVAGDPVVFGPLLDDGWTVAALDQRGHGEATPCREPADYRVSEMGGDLLAVLDDAGWPHAWLCGASMGAAPAIAAAVRAPERIDGLLLLAPAFGAKRNPAADMFTRIADALASGGLEAGTTAWRTCMEARGLAPEVIEPQLVQLGWHDPEAMAVCLREVMSWTIGDELRALGELDLPVAVVVWEHDDIHPAALGRHIAGLVPRGACETLDLGASNVGPTTLFERALAALGRLDLREDGHQAAMRNREADKDGRKT